YLTVRFMPLLNGKRSAGVRIPFGDKIAIIGLFGNGGGSEQSALITTIYDGSNGNLLEGAQVKIADVTQTTDNFGQCIFSPIDAGSYDIEVSKEGYSSAVKPVEIPASSNVYKNVVIYPSNFTQPVVTEISSKYDGTVFYLDGVDFNVEFTVNIDWAGHSPGKVRFITPKKVIEQPISDTTVKKTFNMGTDFGVGGTLKVQAVTSTGGLSEEKEAEFVVIKNLPVFTMAAIDKGPYFSYESKFGANWNFFNEGLDGSGIPSDIPLFGGKPVWLKCIPTVSAEVSSSGEASIGLEFEGLAKEKKIDSGKLAGMSFSLYPMVNIDGQYYPSEHDWDWSGYAGLHGKVELKKVWPFVVMAGPVPVPMYAKAGLSLEAEALLGITSLDPLGLNGKISINPYVRGSLGAGVDEIFAVEGWIGGGLDFGLQFPQEPTVDELTIYLNAGFSIYALLFTWENELLHWEYSLIDKKLISMQAPSLNVETAKIAKRDYINLPNYGVFKGGKDAVKSSSVNTKIATLQQNVFPHSEPAIGCAGQYFYAVWLYDDPARNSINRTKLVFSSFDGARWSDPVPVYDDGTADFHPDIVVFQDGSAAVVWENVKTQLPDDASFEEMKQNLEISISFYNPQTNTWSVPYNLTDNNYLDRSPKIRGADINNLMVIWISNTYNHITGNTQNPNTIYSIILNGSAWEAPEVVVNASSYPNFKKPLIGHDFVYNRKYSPTNFFAIAYFCFDMDEDLSTINDRDIFSNEWHRQTFGGWRKTNIWDRTDDNLPDRILKTFFIADSVYVYFLKENTVYLSYGYLSSGTSPFYTFEGDYSSNIAGVQIVRSPSGRIAFVWTEPEEFSSDIFAVFYDPVSKKFGQPQQLTSDSQTEHSPVFAFYGEDILVGIYDRKEIDILENKVELVCGKKVNIPFVKSGTTDLAFFMYELTDDISFETGSFIITPPNPYHGSIAEIYITVENIGNTVLRNIPVYFYSGNPHNG
ncbi:MAG: carboxypeptidase-like regulatory domain-containing protein, partial [Candidatus Omnitrophica bacterium]|nr:carboxypeptidase-like regulatory domain-containing protein [Candidatus Omnitrophota bacterium]